MLNAIRTIDWSNRWRVATAIMLGLLTLAFFVHQLLAPYGAAQHLSILVLKLASLAAFGFYALLWRPNPLTAKKLRRFYSIRRGFASFVILATLLFLSLFAELLVHKRAVAVWFEGRLYLPTYTAFHPGTDFGLDYAYETDYRDLQAKFREEKTGNWVLMPLIPYDAYENDFRPGVNNPAPPSGVDKHYLGTDKTGRDILARLFYGFRIAMVCSLIFMGAVYLIGVAIGCVMGFFGGLTDLLGQRVVEIWANMPFLYMVIIAVSLIPSGLDTGPRIAILLFIMIIFGWTGMTSYMRTATYREKSRDYSAAAKLLGASTPRIIFVHILPNTIATIVTFIPFTVSAAISLLTALDYLGFGLPVPVPSLGELLKQGTSNLHAPWIVLSAFFTMVIILTLVTFVGEAVRDAFDPRKFTLYR